MYGEKKKSKIVKCKILITIVYATICADHRLSRKKYDEKKKVRL
jgi:hypothetical protein